MPRPCWRVTEVTISKPQSLPRQTHLGLTTSCRWSSSDRQAGAQIAGKQGVAASSTAVTKLATHPNPRTTDRAGGWGGQTQTEEEKVRPPLPPSTSCCRPHGHSQPTAGRGPKAPVCACANPAPRPPDMDRECLSGRPSPSDKVLLDSVEIWDNRL